MENELIPESGREVQPLPDPAPVIATAPPPAAATAPVPAAPEAPLYRDRGTGLVLFGVVQIIMGLFALLMVPLIMLTAFMSRLAPGGSMRPGQYVSTVATYALLSAALITLGVGSVQMRRWARALTLVVSWYGMIMGVLITVLLTAVLPVAIRGIMKAQQNVDGAPPANIQAGIMAVMITGIIVFCAFFLVVVPIAFIVFYSRSDVELTCRYRDPVERWTDRAPLPVLGASVVLFGGSLYMLLVGLTTPLFPLFGRYLTGIPAAGCFVVLAALDLYLAVAIFRLRSAGWWIAVFAVPVRLLSMAITYRKADLMQAYSKMGMSDAQVQMLRSNPVFRGSAILWMSLISLVLFFAYLLWLRRYFKTPPTPPPTQALPAQAV